MDARKIKAKFRNSTTALQRVIQIFSRRGYSIGSMHVKTLDGFKEVTLEFPADFYIYRTVVEQIKKMQDLVQISHDRIDMENQELNHVENLF